MDETMEDFAGKVEALRREMLIDGDQAGVDGMATQFWMLALADLDKAHSNLLLALYTQRRALAATRYG